MGAGELADEFGIPGLLRFEDTPEGLVKAILTPPGAEADLYLQGAQLTHWGIAGEKPVLFTSSRSAFAPGRAIRGGVPIVFPWFGPHPTDTAAPQHGFARVAPWHVHWVRRSGPGEVQMMLCLDSDDVGRPAAWPEGFRILYAVTVGRRLWLDLIVDNRSDHAITFECALHSYFAVSDIGAVSLAGLGGQSLIDKVDGGRRKRQDTGPMRFAGPIDSVYLSTPDRCTIRDPLWGRRIEITKRGAASTIVWNPWRAMADLGEADWKSMLCVETGNVADNAIRLPPGGPQLLMSTLIEVGPEAS
ncbi:MAG TPA: D-hexose-6-phosphate mutarotase [Stellaceae bacterium]|nr:D-hexose-6-phosphate mutarotase [Stellaceae bacterium]